MGGITLQQTRGVWLVVLLLSASSGCFGRESESQTVGSPLGPDGSSLPSDTPGYPPRVQPALNDTTMDEKASGENLYQFVAEFTQEYPNRFQNSPTYEAARAHLRERLTQLGYDVREQTFDPGGVNLIATLPGRLDDMRLVIGSHYDTYQSSTAGAYDGATGVGGVLELARVLRTREWNHTIEFVFFDKEDQALQGSMAYVRQWLEGEEDYAVSAFLYYAMIGINYPCATPTGESPPLRGILKEHSDDEPYERFYESAYRAREGFTDQSLVVENVSRQGNSYSESSFENVNVPNLLIMGEFERQAAVADVPFGSYPFAHNADFQQVMETWCGGQAVLIQAYQLALDYAVRVVEQQDGPPYKT